VCIHTFNPEIFNSGFKRCYLETDTAQGQQQHAKEQNLAGMNLNETTSIEQSLLQLPSQP
jgi:hypothetical protein